MFGPLYTALKVIALLRTINSKRIPGKIDATVEVKTNYPSWNQRTTTRSSTSEPALTVPLEIKTGSNYDIVSHKAQLLFYSLLLSDRYGTNYPR